MEKTTRIKRVLHGLLFPHTALVALLAPVSAALLIYAFVWENVEPVVQYLSYFLSAYALTIVCVRVPRVARGIKTIKQENKYLSQYFGSAGLRVKISLYGSLALNIIYAVMQFGLGLLNRSVWFYALSAYYFLLALMRFFLLREVRKERGETRLYFEYQRYRFCGVMLLFTNLALSVITAYIVDQNRGFSYHYIMTIAMAAHTFFTFTVAVMNLVRYRKYNSPLMSASKAINFAAAMVSMLSLETAMLNAFGEDNSPIFRKIMTASTGTAVCVMILSMAVYMIVHATKQLRRTKEDERCGSPSAARREGDVER